MPSLPPPQGATAPSSPQQKTEVSLAEEVNPERLWTEVTEDNCGWASILKTGRLREYLHTHKKRSPASFPESSHSQTLPQECKSPSICLNTSCNHCGLTDLQTCCTLVAQESQFNQTPGTSPVFILLVSYYLNLRFLFWYTPFSGLRTLPRSLLRKSPRRVILLRASMPEKPFSLPSYLMNRWAEACQLSGFFMGCSGWVH